MYLACAMGAVGVTDSQGKALKAGVSQGGHRSKEAVHVQVQNDSFDAHSLLVRETLGHDS